MQPESSDGFASVGTILPEERAALLPGGSFRFYGIRQSPLPRVVAKTGDGTPYTCSSFKRSRTYDSPLSIKNRVQNARKKLCVKVEIVLQKFGQNWMVFRRYPRLFFA